MVRVNFISPDGTKVSAEAKEGDSILEVAQQAKMPLPGICEGSLACSTCHVVVDPDWFEKLTPPSEDEEDLLDMAIGLEKTSRLGCQIKVSSDLDGIVIKIPPTGK